MTTLPPPPPFPHPPKHCPSMLHFWQRSDCKRMVKDWGVKCMERWCWFPIKAKTTKICPLLWGVSVVLEFEFSKKSMSHVYTADKWLFINVVSEQYVVPSDILTACFFFTCVAKDGFYRIKQGGLCLEHSLVTHQQRERRWFRWLSPPCGSVWYYSLLNVPSTFTQNHSPKV